MALHIDTTTDAELPLPDTYAHGANNQATYSADATRSKEALEKQIRLQTNHPTYKKVLGGSAQATVIYGALAIALLLIIYWEWSVSKEIYEVMISSATPWVPFLGCVAIAFYASVCIGESTSRFSVLSTEDIGSGSDASQRSEAAAGQMYGTRAKRKSKPNWLFHPMTGSIVALLFLGGIYLVSRHRVELLNAAGEMRNDSFQIWLPVILYGVELMLGIPTFFFAIWVYTWLHTRSQRKRFSRARMNELALRESAVEAYTTYLREFEVFNRYASRTDRVEAYLVPPNSDLRNILEESGYNLALGDNDHPSPNASADTRREYVAASSPNQPAPKVNAPHIIAPQNGHHDNRREEDLLALLDESIDSQNRGL